MTTDLRHPSPLELWGGLECTVNRAGDGYLDQVALSGHADRLDDLDRFADLGLRTLRYPVLWERTAPEGIVRADWRWPDERLGRLRELGITPIVGLVHHGSGPRSTSLVDPGFVDGLAAYARAVAERYPWVDAWTPVNEPLTTARFGGLYGHWHPHGRDEQTWARAVLIQCRAVAAAMRAIRRVNPAAKLVQTEDLGKTWSTPTLAYQAEFENERRWLSFDLLGGRVRPGHRMWDHLRWLGVRREELTPFLDEPCPPDLLGINHYLTSERFLDERQERYPPASHGGNGRHTYADVEAVRVLAGGLAGPEGLLREAWERYRLPLAVTEAHLGCTREEQLRWLVEVWGAAERLRATGADVRAVAVWSLLGAFDWDSLLTRHDGRYEPGVFDLRAPRPRPTALAGLVRDLAAGRTPSHPAAGGKGWWRRPARLLYPPVPDEEVVPRPTRDRGPEPAPARPLLVAGAGPLAAAFAAACHLRGLPCSVHPLAEASHVLTAPRPWGVVLAGEGLDAGAAPPAAGLAARCRDLGLPLVAFSSPLAFDGSKLGAYVERDQRSPTGEAAKDLAAFEEAILAGGSAALLLRTGPVLGGGDAADPLARLLAALRDGRGIRLPVDAVVSPVSLPELVTAALDLLIDGERGTWHLAHGAGAGTWPEIARRVAALAGADPALVVPTTGGPTTPWAPGPGTWALASERGWPLSPLADALARLVGRARAEDSANLAAVAGPYAAEPTALAPRAPRRSRRAS